MVRLLRKSLVLRTMVSSAPTFLGIIYKKSMNSLRTLEILTIANMNNRAYNLYYISI